VELDGEPWRTLPAEVLLAAGLDVGVELDRARVRRLRSELRRHEALARASRSIARRDLSQQELAERLARADITPVAREEAVGRLVEAGAVDDERLARNRAGLLAERGGGDALIRHDLLGRGIAAELVESAVAGLDPESLRAARIVERRGATPKTARYLGRKGFSDEAVESVCQEPVAEGAPPAVR
jgi:SOS response regulatory protein OraA/RecX